MCSQLKLKYKDNGFVRTGKTRNESRPFSEGKTLLVEPCKTALFGRRAYLSLSTEITPNASRYSRKPYSAKNVSNQRERTVLKTTTFNEIHCNKISGKQPRYKRLTFTRLLSRTHMPKKQCTCIYP